MAKENETKNEDLKKRPDVASEQAAGDKELDQKELDAVAGGKNPTRFPTCLVRTRPYTKEEQAEYFQ